MFARGTSKRTGSGARGEGRERGYFIELPLNHLSPRGLVGFYLHKECRFSDHSFAQRMTQIVSIVSYRAALFITKRHTSPTEHAVLVVRPMGLQLESILLVMRGLA